MASRVSSAMRRGWSIKEHAIMSLILRAQQAYSGVHTNSRASELNSLARSGGHYRPARGKVNRSAMRSGSVPARRQRHRLAQRQGLALGLGGGELRRIKPLS